MESSPPGTTPSAFPDPIPNIIPFGGISLLAGAPGTGKTALLASMLKDLRDGKAIFGHQPSPITSLGLLCVDRSWTTNRQWFERAGFPEIPVYSVVDDHSFVKSRLRKKFDRIKLFSEFLDKLPLAPGGLVVADPIAMFLGGNLIDYDACAVACLELREIMHDRQLSMIGTAHTAKIKNDVKARYLRLQDQILGSTAIFGYTDTQMYLASPAELGTPHYTFLWNPHLSPPATFDLTRDEQGLFIPWTAEHGGNHERLLRCFPPDDSTLTYTALCQLAATIPLSTATVKRLLKALLDEGQIRKDANGGYARIRPA